MAYTFKEWKEPGEHTFTVPDGITELRLYGVGPGGDGNDDFFKAGGGGAGGVHDLNVNPGDTITIFVGEGGSEDATEFRDNNDDSIMVCGAGENALSSPGDGGILSVGGNVGGSNGGDGAGSNDPGGDGGNYGGGGGSVGSGDSGNGGGYGGPGGNSSSFVYLGEYGHTSDFGGTLSPGGLQSGEDFESEANPDTSDGHPFGGGGSYSDGFPSNPGYGANGFARIEYEIVPIELDISAIAIASAEVSFQRLKITNPSRATAKALTSLEANIIALVPVSPSIGVSRASAQASLSNNVSLETAPEATAKADARISTRIAVSSRSYASAAAQGVLHVKRIASSQVVALAKQEVGAIRKRLVRTSVTGRAVSPPTVIIPPFESTAVASSSSHSQLSVAAVMEGGGVAKAIAASPLGKRELVSGFIWARAHADAKLTNGKTLTSEVTASSRTEFSAHLVAKPVLQVTSLAKQQGRCRAIARPTLRGISIARDSSDIILRRQLVTIARVRATDLASQHRLARPGSRATGSAIVVSRPMARLTAFYSARTARALGRLDSRIYAKPPFTTSVAARATGLSGLGIIFQAVPTANGMASSKAILRTNLTFLSEGSPRHMALSSQTRLLAVAEQLRLLALPWQSRELIQAPSERKTTIGR
jgi:hypothetical protein